MKVIDCLRISADAAIKFQDSVSGAFPAGTNGPHNQVTTPVRNTSHWAFLLLFIYSVTNEDKYKLAAERALSYLTSTKVRPFGYTYENRNYNNGDKCNGVMGQAWPIETLVFAYQILNNRAYIDLANEVYSYHEFDERVGLWKRCDVDGSNVRSFDTTLNHQIWFAASSALLGSELGEPLILNSVDKFLDNLEQNTKISEEGRFSMAINPKSFFKAKYWSLALRTTQTYTVIRKALLFKEGYWKSVKYLAEICFSKALKKHNKEMEIGYQAFHMYALAILYKYNPLHSFWRSETFTKTLKYMTNQEFLIDVMENTYGIGYNPPGIEIAYSLEAFQNMYNSDKQQDIDKIITNLLRLQFQKTFNHDTSLMENVKFDNETYAARLYECARISETKLNIEIVK